MSKENCPTTPRLAEAPELEACTQYRSISSLAIVGLLFGLLSPLALVDPVGWLVPFTAIVVCVAAILRIRCRAASMMGRKAAFCGLFLAVLSAAAAVTEWFAFRFFVERPETIIPRDLLLDKVWGGITVVSRTVDAHLTALRRKLSGFDYEIANVYGSGFILRPKGY